MECQDLSLYEETIGYIYESARDILINPFSQKANQRLSELSRIQEGLLEREHPILYRELTNAIDTLREFKGEKLLSN